MGTRSRVNEFRMYSELSLPRQQTFFRSRPAGRIWTLPPMMFAELLLFLPTAIGPRGGLNPKGIPPQSPRLRGTSYLGKSSWEGAQPQRRLCRVCVTLSQLGLTRLGRPTQGSSSLATLRLKTQSLWLK